MHTNLYNILFVFMFAGLEIQPSKGFQHYLLYHLEILT